MRSNGDSNEGVIEVWGYERAQSKGGSVCGVDKCSFNMDRTLGWVLSLDRRNGIGRVGKGEASFLQDWDCTEQSGPGTVSIYRMVTWSLSTGKPNKEVYPLSLF